ncbi:class I SAM-dependent methyltransferase [Trichothermofontia sp.]
MANLPNQQPLKLYLACGRRRLLGFIHIDIHPEVKPDIIADVDCLEMFQDGSVELIYFHHGLERIPRYKIVTALAEWKRILKPGGILRLVLPDFEALAKLYVLNQVPLEAIAGIIHGDQDCPENTHYWSWDFQSLYWLLTKAGFENIRRYNPQLVNPSEYEDYSTVQFANQLVSLNVEATKAHPSSQLTSKPSSLGQIITLSIQVGTRNYSLKMFINPQEYTQKLMIDAFSKGMFYESEVVNLLIQLLKPGDSFIDVGAHIGYFSLLAAALIGETGLVLTCEPEGANYDCILQNIQLNRFNNLRVLNVAVGDERKNTQFFVNSDNDGGHALWNVGHHPFNQKSKQSPIARPIRMETLDYLIKQHPVHNLKLLKIDTEGAEYSILRGAIDLLSRVKVPYIIAEINRFGLQQMGTNEIELRGFMRSLGYETYVLTSQAPNPIFLKPDQVYQSQTVFNVLFTNQGLPVVAQIA